MTGVVVVRWAQFAGEDLELEPQIEFAQVMQQGEQRQSVHLAIGEFLQLAQTRQA